MNTEWVSLEEGASDALAGSSPRISPAVLPVLPRIPGLLHQLPPSLEGVEEELPSWGVLVGSQGFLPSPHSQHCRAEHRKSEEVPGKGMHSFIQSQVWGPSPAWPRSRWCCRHRGETNLFMGCGSNGVQTHHQTVAAQSGQGWDGGSSEAHGKERLMRRRHPFILAGESR